MSDQDFIQEARRLRLAPNDALLVKVRYIASPEHYEHIKSSLAERLPGVPVIVHTDDVEFTVVSPAEDAA